MEDYLLRNIGVFPVPVFEATRWDNTFEKDPGDFLGNEVLTFQNNAKSIFSRENSTLCSFLRRILRIFLKRDVSASFLYEPSFGIVSTKPLPIKPSKPWPDQDRVKVKKALRGECSVIGLWTLLVSPSSRMSKAYLTSKGGHVRPEIRDSYRSNLKGSLEA
ncbi:argonaute 5 [Sesbania bispinosa]|nr:argonaute 5 [Sesbania bispinosa]